MKTARRLNVLRSLIAISGCFIFVISVEGDEREIAPPPREAGVAEQKLDLPAPSTDPAKTVELIIANVKVITERLAKKDTGTETRSTQNQTLALIDSLLSPSPPMDQKPSDKKGDNNSPTPNESQPMPGKEAKPDVKQNGMAAEIGMADMMTPMGGMKQSKDSKEKETGANPAKPLPSSGKDQPSGRKPRHGGQPNRNSDAPSSKAMSPDMKDPGRDPGNLGKSDPNDSGMMSKEQPPMGTPPKGIAGGTTKGTSVRPSLPFDDDVVKQVWGQMREKDRQQITQFYKDQFMPRYADLLRQYYSSLAERQRPPVAEMRR